MAKKFMTTFVAIAAGFTAQQAVATVDLTPAQEQPATQSQFVPASGNTGSFVLKQAGSTGIMMADHESHASHASHASHVSGS